jgi:hypothetical protein
MNNPEITKIIESIEAIGTLSPKNSSALLLAIAEELKNLNTNIEIITTTSTLGKSLAFIDSLVGWVDLGEGIGKPKSEHAKTHLEAVLGISGAFFPWVGNFLNKPTIKKGDAERMLELCNYLIDVSFTIRRYLTS